MEDALHHWRVQSEDMFDPYRLKGYWLTRLTSTVDSKKIVNTNCTSAPSITGCWSLTSYFSSHLIFFSNRLTLTEKNWIRRAQTTFFHLMMSSRTSKLTNWIRRVKLIVMHFCNLKIVCHFHSWCCDERLIQESSRYRQHYHWNSWLCFSVKRSVRIERYAQDPRGAVTTDALTIIASSPTNPSQLVSLIFLFFYFSFFANSERDNSKHVSNWINDKPTLSRIPHARHLNSETSLCISPGKSRPMQRSCKDCPRGYQYPPHHVPCERGPTD